MPRHEFRPGRLLAGLFFALTGTIYAGDAGGLWETPWFAVIPLVLFGLVLAGVAGATARTVRRRRAASPHPAAAPAPENPVRDRKSP
ncbi:hypothetical protein IAG44_15455 [Streptomyces roseirectus]|uniref:Uncharacterized protein n=1 Tax=Streptomyces roseirectus TaxID=2768066 RepID=A0A7H0ID22_9ACTN|nr:hypothetical protein [Streptomyces roseirectus]QNP70688.1 hypothetical protein IAG44_15455 [Streptomyces roseirectus]